MPRDGSGTYSYPSGTRGAPATPIESLKYNNYIDDVAIDLNTARPIIAGGTGAASISDAQSIMHLEEGWQIVTNYDSHPWAPGSFYSAVAATGAPVTGHKFAGICYVSDPVPVPPALPVIQNVVVEARDISDTSNPGRIYVREMRGGVWSPNGWVTTDLINLTDAGGVGSGVTAVGIASPIADMYAGLLFTPANSLNSKFVVNTKADVTGSNFFEVAKDPAKPIWMRNTVGNITLNLDNNSQISPYASELVGTRNTFPRWKIQLGDDTTNTTSPPNTGSDFRLINYMDDGSVIGTALLIKRSDGTATFAGPAIFGGAISAGGDATVSGNLTVAGTANFNGAGGVAVTGSAGLSVTSTTGISTTGPLVVAGNATFNNSASAVYAKGGFRTDVSPNIYSAYQATVGATTGSFGVSPGGAATFNINPSTGGYAWQLSGTSRMTLSPSQLQILAGNSINYNIDSRAFNGVSAGAIIGYTNGTTNYGIVAYYENATPTFWSFFGNSGGKLTGGVWNASDGRLKNVSKNVDQNTALAAVNAIPVKQFTTRSAVIPLHPRGAGETLYGWVAQDVEKIIPVAVVDVGVPDHDTATRSVMGEGDVTVKHINDSYMLTTLWAAVQALTARVKELEGAP